MSDRASKFVPFVGSDGQYYFRVVAGNGEVISVSEGYTREASVYRAIKSFRNNVWRAEVAPLERPSDGAPA